MPTDHQDDDKALSELLQQIEPPKSPSHLDETILKRARQKAESLRETSDSHNWLAGVQWRSAIAVFSVAAVALSVSLQLINNEQLDDVVQFAPEQAPALDSLPRQQQEELASSDQDALAIAQNVATNSATPQTLQAPAEQTATAELAQRVEADQAADTGTAAGAGNSLARSAATSRAVAPAQQGLASSTASVEENREQTFAANPVDPALLNLLAAVLLPEQLAENELGDVRQRQQSDLIAELLATAQQLSAENLDLAEQRYAERRTELGDDSMPVALEQALELIRP